MTGGQPSERGHDVSIERHLQLESILTMPPTPFPSIVPSSLPTTIPSTYPSSQPSSFPTTIPSFSPSLYPSTQPSLMPSTYPTNIPSIYPTTIPSAHPTTIPSTYPTTIPSTYPSSHPTRVFQFPSLQPSGEPSQNPSIQPSVYISVPPLFSDAAATAAGGGEIADGGDQSAQEQSEFVSSTLPVTDYPSSDSSTASSTDKGGNGALFGVIACVLAFTFVLAVVGVYRMKSRRRKWKTKEVILNNSNLRGGRLPIYLEDDSPTIMVEVRKSTTGGWHGFYGEDQLQSIDFGTSDGVNKDNVREENSLLFDGGLEEIERTNYDIGELDLLSDEDLVKAYHDAMAVDIESEDEADFAMQGVGSPHSDNNHHELT